MPHAVLIVDDDPHIREVIAFALEKAGYRTHAAADGVQALAAVEKHQPALMVLDIGMPEMDGLEVCRRLRQTSQLPILFLSAREDEIDRVVGLEIGGDDYVTKPFSPRELVARVQAILKRSAPKATPALLEKPLQHGDLALDAESFTVRWRNVPVELTAMEFALLKTLLKHPQRVFTRDDLMDKAYNNVIVSDRTIDSHIRHIRSKCAMVGAQDVVVTVHGVGYKLGTCDV